MKLRGARLGGRYVQDVVESDRVAFTLPPLGLAAAAREELHGSFVLQVDFDVGAVLASTMRTLHHSALQSFFMLELPDIPTFCSATPSPK
jgi:hypothetical protein